MTAGVGGQIGGLQVLLGNEQFMTSRGVSVSGMTDNALALSLDGSLAAVLTVDYTVPAVLFHAMQKLTEQKTTIWLNSHNQQITPQLVEQLYGLPKGTVVVPELECSRALQNPARVQDARLCALLMRDGLMGIADCICAARAQRKAHARRCAHRYLRIHCVHAADDVSVLCVCSIRCASDSPVNLYGFVLYPDFLPR